MPKQSPTKNSNAPGLIIGLVAVSTILIMPWLFDLTNPTYAARNSAPGVTGFINCPPGGRNAFPGSALSQQCLSPKWINWWGLGGSDPGGLQFPWGLDVEADGSVVEADFMNDRIQRFSPTGELLGLFGSTGTEPGQFRTPLDVAVAADGSMYVADQVNCRIQQLTYVGNPIRQWGTCGFGLEQFNLPYAVAVGPTGNVYVAENNTQRIQYFTSTGEYLGHWGTAGHQAGQFDTPRDIAIDANGFVYVVDSGNNRIQKFTSDGQLVLTFGHTGAVGDRLDGPFAIDIEADGTVYVADGHHFMIRMYDGQNGALVGGFGGFGFSGGLMYFPSAVAVDSARNHIFVGDTYLQKISRFGFYFKTIPARF